VRKAWRVVTLRVGREKGGEEASPLPATGRQKKRKNVGEKEGRGRVFSNRAHPYHLPLGGRRKKKKGTRVALLGRR